jgi:hypothetical protein
MQRKTAAEIAYEAQKRATELYTGVSPYTLKHHDFVPENSPEFVLIKMCWDLRGYSWICETDIPHESFDILDDGNPYCRGIIFSVDDMPKLPF